MFKFFKPALLWTALFFAQPAIASDLLSLEQDTMLQDTHLHTYTHILGLKPIPSESYKLAKATFLPEAGESAFGNRDSLDRDYNTADCTDKSSLYTTKNCTYPRAVVYSSKCPFAPGYYKECACLPQFKISTCTTPKILSSPTCNGKAASCVCPSSVSLVYTNDRCTQYCDGKCVAKSCTPTASETGCLYGTTSVSDGCGGTRTVCKPCNLTPCSGISSKPANSYYTTKSCTDCSGTKTINSGWACNSGYHQSGSSCVKDCTPATSETGCSYGTYSCSDGCGGTRTCCSGCSKPTCSGISSKPSNSSYTTASCTDCSGTKTINTGWTCNSGYHQSGSACVQDKAAIGDILYSDMTTSSNLISGKTAIGVVFNGDKRLAMGLHNFANGHLFSYGYANSQWTADNVDVPQLANKNQSAAFSDWNGKENTKTVLSYCKTTNMHCPAFEYANNYTTAGTSSGDWYLPAFGEVVDICNNLEILNSRLQQLNGDVLDLGGVWSSTEKDQSSAWAPFINGDGTYSSTSYHTKNWVRRSIPVINY